MAMSEDTPVSARRAAIVAAARAEFFAHGYGKAAMSAVAARVGGSKTTLWAHFPSKQALFAAVVDDLVGRFGAALADPLDADLPLDDALWRFGRGMMGIVGTPEIVDLHRIVAGEAGRFPEIGAMMWERGPKRGKAKLADYLRQAMGDGRVRAGDPARAAREFAALCQAGVHQDRLWGLPCDAIEAQVEADIANAVDSWTRAWATLS